MFYHGLSWFIMFHHVLSWFIMLYHVLSIGVEKFEQKAHEPSGLSEPWLSTNSCFTSVMASGRLGDDAPRAWNPLDSTVRNHGMKSATINNHGIYHEYTMVGNIVLIMVNITGYYMVNDG